MVMLKSRELLVIFHLGLISLHSNINLIGRTPIVAIVFIRTAYIRVRLIREG